MGLARRILRAILYAIPPIFAALQAGATEIANGQLWPWRPVMIDLDIYVRTGRRVLAGQPFYSVPGDWLPFIYPPIAAVLSVPLTLLPKTPTQLVWMAVNALMLMACLHRLKFTGWRLSALTVAAIWLVEPVRVTLGFGQVNVFLMALVFLDLMPGPRLLGERRLLPQGWLTGLATAIKLTPLLFVLFLFLTGRLKAAATAIGSLVVATLLGFAVLPGASREFWGRLVGGDSGINAGLKYFTNQSVIGNYVRFAQLQADRIPLPGLLLALVVGGLGVVAAVLWHRQGHPGFALCLTALSALYMSPISWSHHFVWIAPFAVVLLARPGTLPDPLRYFGLLYALWVAYAPFGQLPDGENELKWRLGQKLIDAGSMTLGTALFVLAIAYAVVERRRAGLPLLPLTLREDERHPGGRPRSGATAVE